MEITINYRNYSFTFNKISFMMFVIIAYAVLTIMNITRLNAQAYENFITYKELKECREDLQTSKSLSGVK